MSRPRSRGAACTRRFARLLLRLYPRDFRHELGEPFLDAAEHRWHRERVGRKPVHALWRAWTNLLADTARAAPREWRRATDPGDLWRDSVFADVRHAVRKLAATPGFTALAIVTLALAIGANTAILSIADAVLFRPLPYEEPDRVKVVEMLERSTGERYLLVRYPYLRAIEEHHTGIEGGVGMLESGPPLVVRYDDGPEQIRVARASANYFRLLGVRAWRGRLFGPGDGTGPGRPAVLSYAGWRNRFGGDPGVVGRTVAFGQEVFDVLGILPPDFVFPSRPVAEPELVGLMDPVPAGTPGGTGHPVVRLREGVGIERAQAELDALAGPLAEPTSLDGTTVPALRDVRQALYATSAPILELLLTASGLVLLLGCANLANLLLVRCRSREAELGVRSALGATRARILRPLIAEALLLSLAGAAVAAVVAAATFDALLPHVPPVAFGAAHVGVDTRVVAVTLGLGLAAGLAFSVVPAWRSVTLDARRLIRSGGVPGGRGRGLLGRPLVTVQVALAVVLVFGAALAGRSFVDLLRMPLGFEPAGAALLSVGPPPDAEGLEVQGFYRRVADALGRRPDVVSAGATSAIPLVSPVPWAGITDPSSGQVVAGVVHVLPGYLEAAAIPLVAGRMLDGADVDAGATAVVSEAAARALVPGRDPVGATFEDHLGRPVTIVGVVADTRQSVTGEREPPVYLPPGGEARRLTLVVRSREPGPDVLESLRADVQALAPESLVAAAWWDDRIAGLTAYRNPRFQALVLGGFAVLALAVTAVGVFAVVAFLAASRTREMGIRRALGCTTGRLETLVVRQALAPVALGLTMGLAATRVLAALAEAQLYEVRPDDPRTLFAAAAVVLGSAALAAYLPARRAARVDPTVAQKAS